MDCGDESGERVEMGVGVLRGGEVGRELVSGVEGREAGEGDGEGDGEGEGGLESGAADMRCWAQSCWGLALPNPSE